MTRPHSKIGIAGRTGEITHFTPFQLLLWASEGDGWAAHRFREYAEAFHGKRMLSWSPHLKKKLLGDEPDCSDEEIAAAALKDEAFVDVLSGDRFAILLSRNKVGEFLRYVSESCTDPETAKSDIEDYLESIAQLPATHRADRRQRRTFGGGYAMATEVHR